VHWDREVDTLDGIWVVNINDESTRFVAAIEANPLGWSPDDAWIYFWRQVVDAQESSVGRVHRLSGVIDTVAILPWVPSERSTGAGWIDLSKDATRVVCLVDEDQQDVWLIENFDPYIE